MKNNKKRIIVTFQDLKDTYKSAKYYNLALSKYKNILPLVESEELAKIVAGLLTDGFMDIRPRLRSTYYGYIGFFSKNEEELKEFENLIYIVFGIKGKIKEWGRRTFGKSKGYIITNSVITRILSGAGVPGGDKVRQKYELPAWIINSKDKVKASFLRQVFDCEGSIGYCKNKRKWEIRYSMFKSKKLSDNCKEFLQEIRNMLNDFGIKSALYKKEEYIRQKDNLEVAGFFIRVDDKQSVLNYARQIGFGINYKQERLNLAEKFYKSGPSEI